VQSVSLLGSSAEVKWEISPQGLVITPPADLGNSQHAWSFEIVTDQPRHVPNVIQTDASKALKGTKKVDLEGHVAPTIPNVPGSSVAIETASSADGFKRLVPQQGVRVLTANQKTSNTPLSTLTDGKLTESIGPVFKNGVRNGAYKLDLGAVVRVSAINSWSHNWKKTRGAQKLTLYGLGAIDTAEQPKTNFTAASLRAAEGQALGEFRWIIWAVSPVAKRGANTAFQELSVEINK